MADTWHARVLGLDDLKRALQELSADLRRRVVRGALRDAAKPIQLAARAQAPVLHGTSAYRLPGTVRDSIVVRASKLRKALRGELGVYVKPRHRGLGGKSSSKNPFDPFYYRFLEMGTNKMRARPFLGPAFAAHKDAALTLFQARIGARIAKANARK